jgi:hypothetical protein
MCVRVRTAGAGAVVVTDDGSIDGCIRKASFDEH